MHRGSDGPTARHLSAIRAACFLEERAITSITRRPHTKFEFSRCGTRNEALGRPCAFPEAQALLGSLIVASLRSHNSTPANDARQTPQNTKESSTIQRGASPTRRNTKGRKFHVVICT